MNRIAASFLTLLLVLSLLAGCGGAPAGSGSVSGSASGSISGSSSGERGPGFGDASDGSASSGASSDISSAGSASSGAASSPDTSVPASSSGTGTATGSSGQVQAPASGQTQAPASGQTQTPSAPTAQAAPPAGGDTFRLSDVPAYSGSAYVAIHDNTPYFSVSGLQPVSLEDYSELDSLGRCGTAYACVGQDIMPTEERGSIGQVKPTGWHTVRYDNVDGKYLYNRCHLIGYQLSAENANTRNLITGTRYLNIEGMLPFENLTADYVKETGNHVAYRVTPVFDGDDLVARGVLMEGWSVEDQGDGVCFCVFAYNVQPGISIDYATGDSALTSGGTGTASEPSSGTSTGGSSGTSTGGSTDSPPPSVPVTEPEPATPAPEPQPEPEPEPEGETYVLNTNTKKFHVPSCSSVKQMKSSNREDFTGTRDEVIAMGYDPCKRCNP